jgi:hypothetical protein
VEPVSEDLLVADARIGFVLDMRVAWRKSRADRRDVGHRRVDPSGLVHRVVYPLGQASDPRLRTAPFELSALTPGVERAPGAIDPRARSSRALGIPTHADGSGGRITTVFDPDTSEPLSWSEVGTGAGMPDQSHTILNAGQVAAIGDLPSRRD